MLNPGEAECRLLAFDEAIMLHIVQFLYIFANRVVVPVKSHENEVSAF